MTMPRCALVAMVAASVGCVSVRGIDADYSASQSRRSLNVSKHECMLPMGDCAVLGLEALHASEYTKRKTWTEPVDRAVATQALERGCENGEGKACRALVEFALTASPQQREWAIRRAAFYGSAVRAKAEVDAEQAKLEADARKEDEAHEKELAQRQAEYDRDALSVVSEIGVAAANKAYRYAKETDEATAAATNTKLGLPARVDQTIHHANEAARVVNDKPLIDICVPCKEDAESVAAACKKGMSDACLGATNKLTKCLEAKKCEE